MNMTSGFTKFAQVLGTLLQVLNAVNVASLPPKWQQATAGSIAALQALEGVAAHYRTPAGHKISGKTGKVKDTATGDTVATVPTTKL